MTLSFAYATRGYGALTHNADRFHDKGPDIAGPHFTEIEVEACHENR